MLRLRFLSILLALSATGCSDDETTAPPDDPYLNITITPPLVTMPVGGSATLELVITRGGLYGGTIALQVEGLPQNVTGTFVPATLIGSATRSTLTIAAGAQAAPGSCNFVVRASGAGVADAVTQTISCVVTP